MKTGAKICIAMIALFLLITACFPLIAPQILGKKVSQDMVTPSTQEAPYYLGIYEEKLASFETGNPIPIEIYDIPVHFFSEYDQDLLKKGIPAEDKDALSVLVENYTS